MSDLPLFPCAMLAGGPAINPSFEWLGVNLRLFSAWEESGPVFI